MFIETNIHIGNKGLPVKTETRYSKYNRGKQPCADFLPSETDKEWWGYAQHQCPKCGGLRMFCDNCNLDHHENGWDKCMNKKEAAQ